MGKRIFWIFILTIAVTTAVAVLYIQSESFARLAKAEIQKAVARDLGLELNFDRLRIGILPPSLSLVNVDVKVNSRSNPLGLATDTVIRAESLGFSFRMIQAFSRGLAVNKVFFSDGEVRMLIPSGKGGAGPKLSEMVHKPLLLPLAEGFTASIRQLEVRNTKVDLSFREGARLSRVAVEKVGYLALTPSEDGTNVVVNLEDLSLDTAGAQEQLKVLKGSVDVQRNALDIFTLDAQRKDLALHASGKILGSVDNLSEARPDIDLILRGPITELGDFEEALLEFGGEILADLKVVGRIKDPAVQGKLEIDRFRHSLWSIGKIQAGGSFGSGVLTLDYFRAEEGGGRLSLRNKVELPLPFSLEQAAVQLKLENLNFHDFAGDLLKSVNNLKMGLNGTIDLKLNFQKKESDVELASIALKPDLQVNDLELSNQAYGKSRPYKRIFHLEPFKLTGAVGWRPGEVKVNEGRIEFASGALAAKGTVTSARGFDLTGNSDSVNIGQEVKEISGMPVTGQGAISVHVHGPDDNVILDFDLKQKDARFVNFDFGEIEGKVTFDEAKSYIHIPGVKGRKNSSTYAVSGKVNVGDGDDIRLDASFAESDPNDIFAVFAHQLKDISWIPHGMTGTIEGTAKVGGGYSEGLDTLSIDGLMKGRNLSYMGEMVHEAEISANLRDAKLKARILKARKYEASLVGEIEYKLTGEMKYFLEMSKAKFRSLDFVSSSGIPIDGIFSLRSDGQGRWETLDSTTSMELKNAFVRTRSLPPVDLLFRTKADASDLSVRMGPGAEFRSRMAYGAKDFSNASLKLRNASLDFLLCAVNKRSCADPRLELKVDAEFSTSWQGNNWRQMAGSGEIHEVELAKSSFQLRSVSPAKISASGGLLKAERLQMTGEQSRINLNLQGKVDGSEIDTTVQGDSSLRLLEFISPLIEEAKGKLGISVGLSGSLEKASFRGNLDVQDGFLRMAGVDAPVDALNGRVRFSDSRITVESMNGQLGGGSVQATGSIDLFLNRAPRFDLDLFLANNRVKFIPVNYAEISEAKLSLTGDKPPYLFGGTVRIKRVMMRNNFDAGSQKGLKNARYLPEKLTGPKSFYELRIRAIADGGVMVENNLLNAEFKGEVTLLNNFEFPQLVARAELVRGRLLFRNTAFTLDHAYIRAPNPEVFNPQFSIGGLANVDNYRINIFASGTIEKPKITLSSYPALPQEDIVSLLAFGYRGEDARRVNQNDSAAITYSEVGSILLEQLQLNQNLQSKGLRVSVVPSLNDNETSIIRPNSTQTASPKVYLQTQIMKNLDAAFGGSVGSSQGQSLDAKLEYRLGRKASVSAIYEQTPAGLDATETKNSYGADLKFRWGFK